MIELNENQIQRLYMVVDFGEEEEIVNAAIDCERGGWMEINYIEALKWYKLAAIAGIRDAQNNLAMFYLKGMGTKVDLVAAIK